MKNCKYCQQDKPVTSDKICEECRELLIDKGM